MMYDLGRMNVVQALAKYFSYFGLLLLIVLGYCVIVAISARIGDWIIGW